MISNKEAPLLALSDQNTWGNLADLAEESGPAAANSLPNTAT